MFLLNECVRADGNRIYNHKNEMSLIWNRVVVTIVDTEVMLYVFNNVLQINFKFWEDLYVKIKKKKESKKSCALVYTTHIAK